MSKDRCRKCYSERATRQCLRFDRVICWDCCNSIRVDMKCPLDCPYTPKQLSDCPFPAFKADTNHEAISAMSSYINRWVGKKLDVLDGRSPLEAAQKDQAGTIKWLSGFSYPGNFPLEYLMTKLGLSYEPIPAKSDPEDIVAQYLNSVISLEFQNTREYTTNDSQIDELGERYSELISNIPFFKKIKKYSFIHTGISEDGAQAIVFIELNHKQEWCFILRNISDNWRIRQSIIGNPSRFFNQNQVYHDIATLIANKKDEKAWNEISEALRTYPDSADLYYYRALYWLLVNQFDRAKIDLFNAIALDNYFTPPYMHLGLINLNEKNYIEAKLWFAALVNISPEDQDAINNLAIAHLALGEKDDAIKLWQDILQKYPTYDNAKRNLELYR